MSARAAAASIATLMVVMALPPAPAAASDPEAAAARARERLPSLEEEARRLAGQTRFLLDQYGRDVDPPMSELERRFSQAEIHFLLEDYPAAIVLLYEIIDSPRFRADARHGDALYYLAESLYRQESFMPARGFFQKLVESGSSRWRDEATVRLIQISGRLRDYADVELHYLRMLDSLREIRPEVRYEWGKLVFNRQDLDDEVRWQRAAEAFGRVPAGSTHGLRARYFHGVVLTQRAKARWERAQVDARANEAALAEAQERLLDALEECAMVFLEVLDTQPRVAADTLVHEQAWLALGRVYLEMGRYGEAIDAYQRISRHSRHYFQSLYEVAWAFVRRGDLENARRASEILLTGAGDSPLAPEIRLLLGHLHARAGRHEQALEAYDAVITEYAPVRDELEALLSAGEDPVEHFGSLIENDGGFDVETLLPDAAVRWASTQQDVERGLGIVSDLDAGRAGIVEGRQIADRILASLDAGTLEPFPTLAEGHRRATVARSEMLQVLRELADVEHAIIAARTKGSEAPEYERARMQTEVAAAALGDMPATPEELARERASLLEAMRLGKRELFKARMEVRSYKAQVGAMSRLLRDRERDLVAEEGDVEAFQQRLSWERAGLEEIERDVTSLKVELDRASDAIRAATAGEKLRAVARAYTEALDVERRAASELRAEVDDPVELETVDAIRAGIMADERRIAALLEDVEGRGASRRRVLRGQVLEELARLDAHQEELGAIAENTRDLVGRIAFDSVAAIREHFYDLVLRSDVGIIDVAWAQKSVHSQRIQQMVEDKDRQLRSIDRDFREVLRDPDAELER